MKRMLAAIAAVVAFSASGAAPAADGAQGPDGKKRASKQTAKVLPPGELFAETKKYLAEKAAKTADIIRTNASKLKKSVSPEVSNQKKARPKRAAERVTDPPPSRPPP